MSIFRRIKNKLTRSQHQQEIKDELQSHIEMRIADAVAAGMSPEEARRDAQISLIAEVAGDDLTYGSDEALLKISRDTLTSGQTSLAQPRFGFLYRVKP